MKKALILSGIAWDSPWQRHQILSTFLACKGYEVDFVESVKSASLKLTKVINKIKENSNKRGFSKRNQKHFYVNLIKSINPPAGIMCLDVFFARKAVESLRYDYDLVVVYIPRSYTLEILSGIKYKRLIYDCVRDFEHWGGYCNDIIVSERILLKKADNVFCDSYWLKDKLKEYNPIQILPTIPSDLKIANINSFKVKVITSVVYFGTFSNHVCADTLEFLNSFGIKVGFIGQQNSLVPKCVKNHDYIPEQNKLVNYISNNFDAVIIPYKGNMDGVIPSKILLALTTGKPVIISRFHDSMVLANTPGFSESVYVYDRFEDILDIIRLIEVKPCNNYLIRYEKLKKVLERNRDGNFERFLR